MPSSDFSWYSSLTSFILEQIKKANSDRRRIANALVYAELTGQLLALQDVLAYVHSLVYGGESNEPEEGRPLN